MIWIFVFIRQTQTNKEHKFQDKELLSVKLCSHFFIYMQKSRILCNFSCNFYYFLMASSTS